MDIDPDMPAFLESLAKASARVILPLFRKADLEIRHKADQSPVTEADRQAEILLREQIQKAFPDHGIIGEEFGKDRPDAEYTWVLDPIDGTISFAAGCPLFGTLICLRKGDKPLWGALHLPALGQLFIGNNSTCWLNGNPLSLGAAPQMEEAFLLSSDLKNLGRHQPAAGWEALVAATGRLRTWGDCYGYTLVCTGGAHIMADPVLNLWDIAAILPVVRGAGAAASDWQGKDANGADSLVVAHPDLHPQVIRLLNPNPVAK